MWWCTPVTSALGKWGKWRQPGLLETLLKRVGVRGREGGRGGEREKERGKRMGREREGNREKPCNGVALESDLDHSQLLRLSCTHHRG